MRFWEVFVCACGLSVDAFAAAVCKGTSTPRPTVRRCFAVGLWFGVFQALMPLIGYMPGSAFYARLARIDHWIAFALLTAIGVNLLLSRDQRRAHDNALSPAAMLPAALATSVDALAVGVTFALTEDCPGIGFCSAVIGAVAFAAGAVGLKIGSVFGERSGKKAQRAGGALLIGLGLKILASHLGWIPF